MIVTVEHLDLTYQSPDGEVEALRDVSLSVAEGEFVSIVGPSGCGKSTLLSAIAGLEKPSAGTVAVDGEVVTAPSPKIGYMPQKDQLFPWRTIWANVTLGTELRREGRREGQARARELLERYGLQEFAKKTPGQLSDGGKQESVSIGVNVVQNLLLRPGQLPRPSRKSQIHMGPHFKRDCKAACSFPFEANRGPP